jgi:hypothetical protein
MPSLPVLPNAVVPVAPLRLDRTYRLVTRSDFDGLVCAALLKELGILDDILFVHPKDVQDGKVQLTPDDITTNLPYRREVALALDHHSSEQLRITGTAPNRVIAAEADSAARVVYDHFGGAERFPGVSAEMMEAVDRADAARLSMDDILDPQGWILLSFLMDPRTGLGRFRDFRISNYELMMQLIGCCLTMPIAEILESPDVAQRTALYDDHASAAVEQIRRCSTVHDRVVVLDLRHEEVIHPTNRFLALRAVSGVPDLDPRALGPAAAEHRVRARPLDRRPLVVVRHRRDDVGLRRRRSPGCRDLPDQQHGCRRRARRIGGGDLPRRTRADRRLTGSVARAPMA